YNFILTHLYSFCSNHSASTDIYPLSLHDALPILHAVHRSGRQVPAHHAVGVGVRPPGALDEPDAQRGILPPRHGQQRAAANREGDRKSTRLNSSHVAISYAVFCLKKKKK